MSRRDFVKNYGGVVLVAIGMIVGAGFFVARAVADARVTPVETRVTTLEVDQKRQDEAVAHLQKSLDEQHADIKELLRRVRP